MRQFTSDELRKAWKQFYIDRGHVDVGAVSLVSDGSTGVMFNVAGMQPLMPYLLGQKHPLGTRLCNVQGCVRTNDIDSVGDKSHVTFFEMMGSWSLGDYFKKERCQWSFELLTQVFGFDADHLAATVFAGDENAPRDEEGAQYRIASGFKKKTYIICPLMTTGGDWNMAPAVPTVRCSISLTDRIADRTADPAVTVANTPSWVMMYSCSMRSIMTVI